jgi:hypothetical protein
MLPFLRGKIIIGDTAKMFDLPDVPFIRLKQERMKLGMRPVLKAETQFDEASLAQ